MGVRGFERDFGRGLMDQHQITNLHTFPLEERRYIIHLKRRAKYLRGRKEKNGVLGRRHQEELTALEWVFNVLNEISEDD